MEDYKPALGVMAVNQRQCHGEHRGQCRQLTPAELDARVEVGWDLPGLRGGLAAWAKTMRSRWRPRVSPRIEPPPAPSAVAPSPG